MKIISIPVKAGTSGKTMKNLIILLVTIFLLGSCNISKDIDPYKKITVKERNNFLKNHGKYCKLEPSERDFCRDCWENNHLWEGLSDHYPEAIMAKKDMSEVIRDTILNIYPNFFDDLCSHNLGFEFEFTIGNVFTDVTIFVFIGNEMIYVKFEPSSDYYEELVQHFEPCQNTIIVGEVIAQHYYDLDLLD